MTPVSREEIAECLESAFGPSPLSAAAIVDYAAGNGARRPVIAVLHRLCHDEYRSLRELWPELADVPFER